MAELMAKVVVGSFTVALALAGLALGTVYAPSEDAPAYLELLGWLFFIGALVALGITVTTIAVGVVLWIWRYFHAVVVQEGNWHGHYWPLQRIAQVSGVPKWSISTSMTSTSRRGR